MPVNATPISQRNLPFQQGITANGSYTLPQQGFVPPAGSRPLGRGIIPAPGGAAVQPLFIQSSHVDAGWLPGVQYARGFGIQTQTAQIQVNTSILDNG